MLLTDSGYRGRRHARGSKRKKLKTKGSAMILSIVKYSNLSLSFQHQRNGLGAIYRVEVRDLNQ